MGDGPGFTLGQIAEILGAALDGDAARRVTGVAPLDTAGPDDISFLTDLRYHARARRSRAGAFLAPADVTDLPAPVLRSRAPRQALVDLLRLFHPAGNVAPGRAASAIVAASADVDASAAVGAFVVIEAGARIGPRVRLDPFVYVGAGAVIGDDCVLRPRVVVLDGVRVGCRVTIHAGAVIGADGFGYVFDGAEHRKIPQVGGVVIEDDVEIGANTAIDRATLGATVIGRGTKIDNLVQIGHNVEIGERSIIVAQVGISGSCRIGRDVVLSGQVGVADHLTVGDGAMIGAQAGLATSVEAGAKLWGTPARPILEAKRLHITLRQLPDMVRRVRELERRLSRLEGKTEGAREGGPDAGA